MLKPTELRRSPKSCYNVYSILSENYGVTSRKSKESRCFYGRGRKFCTRISRYTRVVDYQGALLRSRLNSRGRVAVTNLAETSGIKLWVWPYHYSSGNGYTSTAVRVGYDVAETHAQKRDCDEPHSIKEIRVLLVVEPGAREEKTVWNIRVRSSGDGIIIFPGG